MVQEQSATLSGERSSWVSSALRHRIALPEASHSFDQGAEWMVVEADGRWREIRLDDYAAIYSIPGLYEQIFHDVLKCDSPRFMSEVLRRGLAAEGAAPSRLRVLDLGAGNGVMGAELRALGAGVVVGVDVLEAAAAATARDRPGCYDAYRVMDLSRVPAPELRKLREYRFNALTCVAALRCDDARLECFHTAFNLLGNGGWVVLTIRHSQPGEEGSGFAGLIEAGVRSGAMQIVRSEVYRHRLTTNGEPLNYTGVLVRKCAPLLVEPRRATL